MKRYRVLQFDFDSRAVILSQQIDNEWGDSVKQQFLENQKRIAQEIIHKYGTFNDKIKINNFIDLGPKTFSIIAYHNKLNMQIRDAFVIGSYYPALTGACALGERIINHLILKLRDYFKSTPEYRKVYRKDSFDNWNLAISILEAWDILTADVPEHYRSLQQIRNRSIHFQQDVERNERAYALEAIRCLSEIIQKQFGVFGLQPWFIKEGQGAAFITKNWQEHPFIKEFYLSNSVLVSPYHQIEINGHSLVPVVSHQGEDREISDEEYIRLYQEHKVKLIAEQQRSAPGPKPLR